MENLNGDLKKASDIFIMNLLSIRKGDRFLIYTDEGSDVRTVRLLQNCAEEADVFTEVFELKPGVGLSDLVTELTDKIQNGHFDVICELSDQYYYPTAVWRNAMQLRYRVYSLGGLSPDSLIRCVGRVNHELMFQFGMALRKTLRKAKSLQILSGEGTKMDLKLDSSIKTRLLSKLKIKKGTWVGYPTGIFTKKRRATFMGGQVAFQGISESIEGTAVIDGYLWPPREIGRLEEPIILKIRKGEIVNIGGCSFKSKILDKWLDEKPKKVEHFCIGFNPGANLSGKIVEAERVFGAISIGIGKYPFHSDGIITSPSILQNGQLMEFKGTFVQEELSMIEKKLIQDYQNAV